MFRRVSLLILLTCPVCTAAAQNVRAQLIGTWTLVSRTDSGAMGVLPADGALGGDPISILFYDAAGNVSAQLMARHRSANAPAATTATVTPPNPNNSAPSGGFDSYFGRYTVDTAAGTVTHELIGALAPGDVGRRLTRHFELHGDTLRLWFEEHRADGQPVRRRLQWQRVKG